MKALTRNLEGVFTCVIQGDKSQLNASPYMSVRDPENDNILSYSYIKNPVVRNLCKPEIEYMITLGYNI